MIWTKLTDIQIFLSFFEFDNQSFIFGLQFSSQGGIVFRWLNWCLDIYLNRCLFKLKNKSFVFLLQSIALFRQIWKRFCCLFIIFDLNNRSENKNWLKMPVSAVSSGVQNFFSAQKSDDGSTAFWSWVFQHSRACVILWKVEWT